MLTATEMSPHSFGHSFSCRRAVLIAHFVKSSVRPIFSMIGINTAGDTGPRVGLVQRANASA